MNFKLSTDEIKILKEYHKSIHDKRFADRIKCVIALGSGYSFSQIKEILLINERTARRYFNIFKKKGVDGLLIFNYKGGKSKLTEKQEEELVKHLEENLYSTASEIAAYITKKFNIKYTSDGLVITLHRLGFSYKKTKKIPAKADKKKQKEFIKQYKDIRKTQKTDEKVYFIDGVHPTYNVMPSYAWIKRGKEKEIKSNTGRQRVNINGAYSPDDQDVLIVKSEKINAQSTIKLFKKIEKKNADKSKIYIIADNAKYYSCSLIKEYLKDSKIELVHLPTYSPNLNLIERLWKFFKKKVIYNKYYETLSKFEHAIDYFFNKKINNYREELKKLLSENFHLFEDSG